MTIHAQLASGPVGPDTIGLPGDPSRLRSAAQDLQEMSRQLEQVGQQLQQVAPADGARGRTATALKRAAGRTADVLSADAKQLVELADVIEGAAQALADGQGSIDALRQRWRAARDTFRGELSGARNGPQDAGALMHRIDDNAVESHEAQFQRQAGLAFTPSGGGGGAQPEAMLLEDGGNVQRAIEEYRREVRGILDELAGLMQKAKNADNDLDTRLPRRATTGFAPAQNDGGDDPDHANVSAPGAVQAIGEELQSASQTLARAADRLEDIRLAIRSGRMLPDDERAGSNDGFKRDWTEHLDAICETLGATRRAADTVADRLRQIDQDGAADIRQAGREK